MMTTAELTKLLSQLAQYHDQMEATKATEVERQIVEVVQAAMAREREVECALEAKESEIAELKRHIDSIDRRWYDMHKLAMESYAATETKLAEKEFECQKLDTFRADHKERAEQAESEIAALRQRAEDAELIAWGFQAKRIRDARTFTTIAEVFPDIHWFAETGSAHEYECHDLGSAKSPIVLTPEAREALRKAKERANG